MTSTLKTIKVEHVGVHDGFHDAPTQSTTYYPGQVLETPEQFRRFCGGLTVSQKYWYLEDKKRLWLHGNQALLKYEIEDGETRHLPATIQEPHPDHLAPTQEPKPEPTGRTYYLLGVAHKHIRPHKYSDLERARADSNRLFNTHNKQVTIYQAIETYTMSASVGPVVTKLVKEAE